MHNDRDNWWLNEFMQLLHFIFEKKKKKELAPSIKHVIRSSRCSMLC